MKPIAKAAVALAASLGAVAILYSALGGGSSSSSDDPTIRFATDQGQGEPSNAMATAAGPSADGSANRAIPIDIYLWKSNDVATVAPGTRTGMLGSGKTAALHGTLADARGPVADATIRIIAGLNEGASARTNSAGRYELPGLYPGVAIVEFEAPGQPRTRREARLRPQRDEPLDLTYLSWGNIHGSVFDENGKPIAGARAELDGIVTETDKDGAFFFNDIVPGNCILYLSAPGREFRREGLALRPGQALVFDSNRFLLKRSEPLTVIIDPLPLSPRPPKVLVLPDGQRADRNFPFEKIGVVSPRPGDREVRIEGIPVGEWFQVRVYHDSGVANPVMRPVVLKQGDTNLSKATFSFAWKHPVAGTVTFERRPVADASVRVESSDLARAAQELLREAGGIDQIVVPVLPFARKETKTDAAGVFRIETSEVPPPAVIVVEAPGFVRKVISIKSSGPEDLGQIALVKQQKSGPGKMILSFQHPARREVRLVIDGKPQPAEELPPGARVEIGNLAPGYYGLRVREDALIALDKYTEVAAGDNLVRVAAPIRLDIPSDDEPEEEVEEPAASEPASDR